MSLLLSLCALNLQNCPLNLQNCPLNMGSKSHPLLLDLTTEDLSLSGVRPLCKYLYWFSSLPTLICRT